MHITFLSFVNKNIFFQMISYIFEYSIPSKALKTCFLKMLLTMSDGILPHYFLPELKQFWVSWCYSYWFWSGWGWFVKRWCNVLIPIRIWQHLNQNLMFVSGLFSHCLSNLIKPHPLLSRLAEFLSVKLNIISTMFFK